MAFHSHCINLPDLLCDHPRHAVLVLPMAEEQLTQKGIEWLLDALILRPSCVLLTLERTQEPFQHQQRAFLGAVLESWREEDGRVLRPVLREFDGRFGGEDERGRCYV